MDKPLISICMGTFNRHKILAETLESIRRQKVERDYYEIIVADDGSVDETQRVCTEYQATYTFLGVPEYRNPCFARNAAYRMARGHIIIAQSDDTKHVTDDAITRLSMIEPGHFNVATVWELDVDGRINSQYTGDRNRRPFFFLGSLFRSHLYAIGGDDEDFKVPGFDDNWMADRLMHGLGLKPDFRADVVGHHQWHPRPPESKAGEWFPVARELYRNKRREAEQTGKWLSASGPWRMT